MNFRFVINQLGLLLLVLSGGLLSLALFYFIWTSVVGHDVNPHARLALFISGVLGALVSGGAWFGTRKGSGQLGRREALLLVAAAWLIGAAFAALPYFLWAQLHFDDATAHPFRSFADCYFEAMSGLTTTGATVLTDIEAIPPSLLLWRAFTQWLGGLGIVVMFVAVLPTVGLGGKRLFLVEAPGPTTEGLQPHIRQTARVLLGIYLALTAAQILALLVAGLTVFDSICHTFTTVATAGFSTQNASVGGYQSQAVEIIVGVFMVLGAVNFGLYFALVRGKFKNPLRDPELRTYLGLLLVGSAMVTLLLVGHPITTTTGQTTDGSLGSAIRYGVFNVVAIGTTTGYATADTNTWPLPAKAVLVIMMFIGGSAGSTAGGLKVIRVWIAFKVMLSEIEHVFRPNVVRTVRVGNTIIHDDLKLATVSYLLGIVVLFAIGSLIVMVLEQSFGQGCDYPTAASASLACLCTIGPGLARVGAIENYGWMTPSTKIVLAVLMALGRLEVFAIIVLFTPRFWRAH
ncbi:MAG: TrkH family potassium uptake protein [Planctomycetes bacterium]|nr:TrkH family potassium uptake protein [Planctomycetota bacterium]